MDMPLSESQVSLKLEEIQRRCSDLLEQPDKISELTLEEPDLELEANDPYNHLRA
jgi:hypothetical protein